MFVHKYRIQIPLLCYETYLFLDGIVKTETVTSHQWSIIIQHFPQLPFSSPSWHPSYSLHPPVSSITSSLSPSHTLTPRAHTHTQKTHARTHTHTHTHTHTQLHPKMFYVCCSGQSDQRVDINDQHGIRGNETFTAGQPHFQCCGLAQRYLHSHQRWDRLGGCWLFKNGDDGSDKEYL